MRSIWDPAGTRKCEVSTQNLVVFHHFEPAKVPSGTQARDCPSEDFQRSISGTAPHANHTYNPDQNGIIPNPWTHP